MNTNNPLKHLGLYIKTGTVDSLQLFTVYIYVNGHEIEGIKEPRKTLLPFYRIYSPKLSQMIHRGRYIPLHQESPQAFIDTIVKNSRIPRTQILHPENHRYISHHIPRKEIALRAHNKLLPKNVAHSHGSHSGKNYVELTHIDQMRDHIQQFLNKELLSSSSIPHSKMEALLLEAISKDLQPYLIQNPTSLNLLPTTSL